MNSLKRSAITQKDIKKKILESKDAKKAFIDGLKENGTLFTLKVNQPFYPKNTHESMFLLRLFDHLIMQVFTPKTRIYKESFSGDYIVYFSDIEPKIVKKMAIYIEDQHPIGRLIDIDVYDHKTALTRPNQRACYICDEPAHYCARNQSHKAYEIKDYMSHLIIEYIGNSLANTTALALRKEVFLAPKFGLVSIKDSGAHHDMTYDLFLKSIEALTPYFKAFAEAGFNHDTTYLRPLGIQAEEAMFTATKGVNTHKGAIFIMGAFLPSLALAIYHNQSLESLLQSMHKMISPLIKDDFLTLNQKEALTAGEIIYERYGIKGIRGEVFNQFPSIFSWYPNASYNAYQKLCAIMAHLEDTTIIKRFNLQTLKEVHHDMRDLLKETPFNMEYYHALSERYKKLGISPGGSADLLSLVFLLDETLYLLSQ